MASPCQQYDLHQILVVARAGAEVGTVKPPFCICITKTGNLCGCGRRPGGQRRVRRGWRRRLRRANPDEPAEAAPSARHNLALEKQWRELPATEGRIRWWWRRRLEPPVAGLKEKKKEAGRTRSISFSSYPSAPPPPPPLLSASAVRDPPRTRSSALYRTPPTRWDPWRRPAQGDSMAGAARTTYIPALLPITHQPHFSDRDLKEGSTHSDLSMGREEVPRVELQHPPGGPPHYRCACRGRAANPLDLVSPWPPPYPSLPPPPQSSSPGRGSPCMGNRQREAVHGGRSGQRPDWYCSSPCCVMVGDRIE